MREEKEVKKVNKHDTAQKESLSTTNNMSINSAKNKLKLSDKLLNTTQSE